MGRFGVLKWRRGARVDIGWRRHGVGVALLQAVVVQRLYAIDDALAVIVADTETWRELIIRHFSYFIPKSLTSYRFRLPDLTLMASLPLLSSSRWTTLASSPFPSMLASSSRSFHVSPTPLVSRRVVLSRRRKAKHLAFRSETQSLLAAANVDPVVGHAPDNSSSWTTSRLARTILAPSAVYSLEGPPEHYLPGIGKEEERFLFGTVPQTATAIRFDDVDIDKSRQLHEEQEDQTEILKKVLDLRKRKSEGHRCGEQAADRG